MDHLYLIIAALVVVLVILAVNLGKAHKKISEQELQILLLKSQGVADAISRMMTSSNASSKQTISNTSEKLLALAAKSANPNEASAAAVQACKRIHKELGYK